MDGKEVTDLPFEASVDEDWLRSHPSWIDGWHPSFGYRNSMTRDIPSGMASSMTSGPLVYGVGRGRQVKRVVRRHAAVSSSCKRCAKVSLINAAWPNWRNVCTVIKCNEKSSLLRVLQQNNVRPTQSSGCGQESLLLP